MLDRNLTQSIDIPVRESSIVNATPISNIQSGGLLSDLKITKTGDIVATDSDWNYFDVASVTYSANNTIIVKDLKVFNQLRIGTPIIVTQSSTKYFYVIGSDSSTYTVYLDAGDTYTYTNASVSSIGFSKRLNPDGFPQVFDFSTSMEIWGYNNSTFVWNELTSNFEGGSGIREASYSMNGTVVTVSYNVGTITFPANIETIVFTSPFIQRTQSQVNVGTPTYLTSGTVGGASDNFVSMIWGWINSSGGFTGDPFSPYTLGVVSSPAIASGGFDSGSIGMRNTFVVAV